MSLGLAVLLVGACGASTRASQGAPAHAATTPTTSTTVSGATGTSEAPITGQGASVAPNDPGAAFRHLVAGLPSQHADSGVVTTASGDVAAVSFNTTPAGGGTQPLVQILAFQGGGWAKIAMITLDIGGVVESATTNTTPITVVHLTGGEGPDFAVTVSYNDGPALAIISPVSGSWRALTFTGGPHAGGSDEVVNPTITPTGISERFNTCTPDCAAGHYTINFYRFDPASGLMRAVS